MLTWRAALLAALFFLLQPIAGVTQDVTLTSRDGSVEISGALIGYDGEFYRVDSVYGVLTLDGSGVLCSGPACPDLKAYVAEIRVSGEAAVTQHLMPVLIETFAELQGYDVLRRVRGDDDYTYALIETASGRESARFILRTTTSEEAFADLLAEEADIAFSLREADADEVALGVDAGIGQLDAAKQFRVLALDALVPVVASGNPVARITLHDLARAFSGEITSWQDLGGADAPVILHLPHEGSALSAVFGQLVTRAVPPLPGEILRHETTADLVDAVARDPFALGVATLSELGGAKPLPLTDACGYLARAAIEALKTEDYPLTAPMFLYLPQRRIPAAGRDFLRFTRSAAAQHAIRRAGFADQTLTETPIGQQGNRLSNAIRSAVPEAGLTPVQDMLEKLDGFNRLSVSFRFDGGSTALDAQSRSNVGLLAQAIETGLYDGRDMIFVGFSDGDGDAEANRRLSRQRATTVRDDVVKMAIMADLSRSNLDALGYGEAMPMACDDTDWGRRINRRVEVWVR